MNKWTRWKQKWQISTHLTNVSTAEVFKDMPSKLTPRDNLHLADWPTLKEWRCRERRTNETMSTKAQTNHVFVLTGT